MADSEQRAEELDEDKLDGEYPPDRPQAVEDEGVTGLEQLGGESFAERDERTEPEPWERPGAPGSGGSRRGVELVGDEDVGEVDDEGTMVARSAHDPDLREAGPLAPEDEFTGDETTRDVTTERTTPPAEEDAVHVDDSPPGATP